MVERQATREPLDLNRVQAAVDAMPAPLFFVDRDLRLVSFNRAAVRMSVETLGAVPLEGEPADRFLPPGFHLADNALTREVLAGSTGSLALDTRTSHGSERSYDISVWPAISDAAGVQLFGVLFSEVTDYKDAQDRVRRAEGALRMMIANAPAIILALNAEGVVRFASGGGLARAGFTPGDLAGHNLLTGTPRFEQIIEAEPDNFRARLVVDELEWEVFYTALRRDDRQLTGYVGVAVDISGREEDERRRLVERKQESLVRLSRGLAHDLGNVLTVLVGNSTMLRDAPDLETARLLADEIIDASWRTNTVIRQLLAFSEGTGIEEVRPLDLEALVDEAVRLARNFTPQSLTLQVLPDANLPRVRGEATLLRELTAILLSNAIDAAGANGAIRVRTTTQPKLAGGASSLLAPAQLPPAPWACLVVEDNGPGMSRSTIESVFDPYFTTRFPGRGLGLANALGIVRAHGGAIHVHSEPGAGATFTVILPAIT